MVPLGNHSMSRDKRVDLARRFALQIVAEVPHVSDVVVDDWNSYGEFHLVLVLDLNEYYRPATEPFNLRKTTQAIKYLASREPHLAVEGVNHPHRQYDRDWNGRKTFTGYESAHTDLDIRITSPEL